MAATATRTPPRPGDQPGREETAERLYELLGTEPKSASRLGKELGYAHPPRPALIVLESQGRAKRIGRQGWVRGDADAEARPHVDGRGRLVTAEGFAFQNSAIPATDMFPDHTYQRPATNFVETVVANFRPELLHALAVSDRGEQHDAPARYAIVDGQTRWLACRRLGLTDVPLLCIVYTGLSVQQEAELFAKFQKERRGMTSWDRFRAQLAAGDPESHAIQAIVQTAGYKLGHGKGELRGMAALETCYRRDEFLLERTLVALNRAFPTELPAAPHIRGLHYWMRNPGHRFRAKGKEDIDDDKLVRRLRTAGLSGILRKADAGREMGGLGHGRDAYVAQAIDAIYKSGARA